MIHADPKPAQPVKILGVKFINGNADVVVEFGLKGGLVVVPSAPVLVAMESELELRRALVHADLAVADSGLMVLLWRLTGGGPLPRVSGLEYITRLLAHPELASGDGVFWIMPSEKSRDCNLAWLKSQGHHVAPDCCYLAPVYAPGKLRDDALLEMLRRARPKHVIICLGGGTQERLGLHIRESLDFRPGIHCIGAAIAFLSGDQVRIPSFADRIYLGWFFRSLSDPRRFFPRYFRALRLIVLFFRHRENPPSVPTAN